MGFNSWEINLAATEKHKGNSGFQPGEKRKHPKVQMEWEQDFVSSNA